ncbi:HugZ family protein [Methylocapsa acidiphila]|uniref:Uncharacterized protein n=1 Tax=Methylocapsa acidiphila TaxID=133552 RepID=Q2VNN1_METAI|nr:DUF2470 domain-containing protein [Methylocapsa acidiphila]CAJ01601.1 conserved hypothetical protein [Methylocapsa acidiphila]
MTDAQGVDTPSTPTPYDAEADAKRLLRCVRSGALATLSAKEGGPFVSLVNVATAPDGSPILLVSRLAAHTRQMEADPRVSLLLAETGEGDPLAHPRLTLTGRAARADDPPDRAELKARFLAKHPKAALYADFGDFSFWLVSIEHGHLNGGFGRAGSFAAERLMTPIADAADLIAAEAEALVHLNTDHKDALELYATALSGATKGEWRATGIDPDGLDLACGDETARIVFPRHVESPSALRAILAEIAKAARENQPVSGFNK